jgi:nucleotide-binding universal stress UspA family protein
LLYSGIDPGLVEALEEQEAAVRQEALRLVGGTGVAWKLVIRVGSPGEEIVKVAEESDADLVVLGGNRHSSIHNLLLGSTAAYRATHSPAPVLVMRLRAESSSQVHAAVEPIR